MSKKYWFSLIGLAMAGAAHHAGKIYSQEPMLHEYRVESRHYNGSRPFRIAFINDYFGGNARITADDLLRMMDVAHPDVVVLGGSFFAKKAPHQEAFNFVEKASDRWPCYCIIGETESQGDEDARQVFFQQIEAAGARILRNEKVTIEAAETKIDLLGLDDPNLYDSLISWENHLLSALKNDQTPRDESYRVVCTYRTEKKYIYDLLQADLVLSGHTHGGHWRLPLLGGLYAPGQGFFPKYDGGRYRITTKNHAYQFIVSRGLKLYWRFPRYRNRPEVLVAEISKPPYEALHA